MNALFAPGAKCTRILAAVGLCMLLAAPAVLLWASRIQPVGSPGDTPFEQVLAEYEAARVNSIALPPAFTRPPEFSPFGGLITPRIKNEAQAKDMVLTPLGHRSWDLSKDSLRASLPEKLLNKETEYVKEKGDRTLKAGLNYIQLSPDAIQARGLDQALADLSSRALILDTQPNAIYLVHVEQSQVAALRKDALIVRSRIVDPADKIDGAMGARPMIAKAAATNPNLQVQVTVVPGKRNDALLKKIEAIKGVSEVTVNPFEGTGIVLRVHYSEVDRLARLDEIVTLTEVREMMTSNSENVPTVQSGNAHDGLGIRPFDDAGVDGGGLNAAGSPTGSRTNDGICGGATCTAPPAKVGLACTTDYDCNTSVVPPQIVAVIDNGLSLDTPSFSQTATQVSTGSAPIGPGHRKVHSIIPYRDGGDDCDSALSGTSSHGNIVSSTIAAYPSELGFFANRSGIGGTGQPRNANMDGVARGARIILTDVADFSRCTTNTLYEKGGNVDPGPTLLARMNEIVCPKDGSGACAGIKGGKLEVHVAVLPFGFPSNFSTLQFIADNGTYPAASVDLDTFAYNNRDFLMVVPVGNNGALVGNTRIGISQTPKIIPDLFNGSAADDNPNDPAPIQTSAPATAKNILAVAGSTDDCSTFFGNTDCENSLTGYNSRGPATPQSLRMSPQVVAPNFDVTGNFQPLTAGVAVFRSRDDDSVVPIEAQLNEANFGTSFAAGYVTGAAAVVRDYFAQGMYPAGSRNSGDRMRNVSAALVKAAIAASATFEEGVGGTVNQDNNERNLRRTRALDVGSPAGTPVGIIGNSEQGYGRVVLTDVLPLSNWSKTFNLHNLANAPIENPAAGLLVWDRLGTAEPYLTNTPPNDVRTHIFRVASSNTLTRADNGGVVVTVGRQLRIALAWPDRPSTAGSGGPLINDLDLEIESPGPDGCLGDGDASDKTPTGGACGGATSGDNDFFDGNNYGPGNNNAVTDQWSIRHTVVSGTEKHDRRNNLEAAHINSDPNSDGSFEDSPLYVGRWRVTVKRGCGGSNVGGVGTIDPPVCTAPGSIQILGAGANGEDANANGRLDAGEDGVNGVVNGQLDLPGQDFALVVAGPVLYADAAAPPGGPSSFPAAIASWDRIRYGCSSGAVLNIVEPTTLPASITRSKNNTTFQVLSPSCPAGVCDTETNVTFATGTAPGSTVSVAIPVRLAGPAVSNNGILEADTGQTIVATYAPGGGQKPAQASAQVVCNPDLIPGFFAANAANNSQGTQFQLQNGCDNDENLDSGEVVTYGIAIVNRSRTDDYADVTATLTPTGPGAAAIRVLDSPKSIGRLPGSGFNSIFFHVFVDPTAAGALSYANRVVTLNLALDAVSKGQRISRQGYSFTHAINSDRQTFYYSTDHVQGAGTTEREVRDITRNLIIDPPDSVDPFLQFISPNEDVTFSSLFDPIGTGSAVIGNQLGEDLNSSLTFDLPTEFDVMPNNRVDGGILRSCRGGTQPGKACLANGDCPGVGATCGRVVPWNFDTNNGGFVSFRHAGSTVSTANGPNSTLWEYKVSGLCGFQTQADTDDGAGHLTGAGMWHTGDGDTTTPGLAATVCENFRQPRDSNTPPKIELLFDVLESPIIAKVHQLNDSRNFPYTVEFQRLGFNLNLQLFDGYAGGGVNIDNNVDNDGTNSLLSQHLDTYYTRRAGGWPYSIWRLAQQYFNGVGVDPKSPNNKQRTFGPYQDGGTALVVDAGDRGFSGATENTNPDSTTPIPTATPDYLPFPVPGAPVACICDPSGIPCVTGACPLGQTATNAQNDVAGPVRSFDTSLVGYEGGFSTMITGGVSAPENFFFWFPGPAGNRWQVGIGFWALESPSGTTDYGAGVDDVVFEWKEYHAEDEGVLSHTAACSRFDTIPDNNVPGGGQCATLTVDRTNIFECDSSVTVTVYDAKCRSIGAGNTVPLGGFCTTNAPCGAGGVCTAALPSVTVQGLSDTDSIHVSTVSFQAFNPIKTFTLLAVPGSPGLFSGNVQLSTSVNAPDKIFINPGADSSLIFYYKDDLCDGNRNGFPGADDFNNPDGDGVASGIDKCPDRYDPGQGDDDSDGVGDLCDNCPELANPGQDDINADGVGDDCENDDFDADGLANGDDDCPDVVSTGTGARCATPTTGACDTGTSQCTAPPRNVGRACLVNSDCNYMDRDFDGVPDGLDNCVSTYNPSQTNTDGDNMGDVCDPDCTGPFIEGVCRANPWKSCQFSGFNSGTCNTGHSAGAECIDDSPCEGVCVGGISPPPGTVCTANAQCDVANGGSCDGGACVGSPAYCTTAVAGTCGGDGKCTSPTPSKGLCRSGKCVDPIEKSGLSCTIDHDCARTCAVASDCNFTPLSVTALGVNVGAIATCFQTGRNDRHEETGVPGHCSLADDDLDVDDVEDAVDNCPTVPNPPIIAGTKRQLDSDRNSRGDACDPPGNADANINGIPDDIVSFTGAIACRLLPLANLTLVAANYHDLGGTPLGPDPSTAAQGDDDAFPDTAETGRVKITLANNGVSLTDAQIILTTTDPQVACITSPVVLVGSFPAGSTLTVGTIPGDAGFSLSQPGFQFTVCNATDVPGVCSALENPGPPTPAPRIDMCVTVVANETLGVPAPVCFALLADVDLPGTVQLFTLGEDGSPNTADDGTVSENFDRDRNGDGNFTVADTFLAATSPGVYRGTCSSAPGTSCLTAADCPPDFDAAGPEVCYGGHYLQGSATGVGVNVVAGVPCGGYDDPAAGNPDCILATNYYMDWHFHCPPGVTNCPNNEELRPGDGPRLACNAAHTCSYNTPADGIRAHSCPNNVAGPCNSLHMGAHFDATAALSGDGQHFRTLQAFVSSPMNLAAFPRPGDLTMTMYHIARMMDDNGVGGGHNGGQCSDCADVQIQIDNNVDPTVDEWGFWDKLAPFQNVYDHKPMVFSAFTPYYCLFTPTDTGTAPPAPRTPPVHETMCYPQGAWSRCGSTTGTSPATFGQCTGPGFVDPSGIGVWVQSGFNLSGFLGQRVRVRWIGNVWFFGSGPDSYFEVGSPWNTTTADDGWWLDDIQINGTITTQITPVPDTKARSATCPATCTPAVGICTSTCSGGSNPGAVCESAADCLGGSCSGTGLGNLCGGPNPACAGGTTCTVDNGTRVRLKVVDLAGNILDGTTSFATEGQSIRISAINTTIPGGCSNGGPEFRFEKDGVLVQDWSTKTFYQDAPEHSAHYHVLARCSTATTTCFSIAGRDIDAFVFSADGGDAVFGITASPLDYTLGVFYDRALATTTLRWNAPGNQQSDVYRGRLGAGSTKGTLATPFWTLDTSAGSATCLDQDPGAGITLLANVTGTAGNPGTNYTSGALNQSADPNPGIGSAIYYLVVANAPNGSSLNQLGCANPAICNSKGWCNQTSDDPGRPCTVDADCPDATPTAGRCQIQATYCTTDSGIGDEGGCGRHRVCSGGANNGRLCNTATAGTDCPGGTCPAPASTTTAGQLCFNLSNLLPRVLAVGNAGPPAPALLNPDASRLPPANGCLGPGHAKRLVRQAPSGVCP